MPWSASLEAYEYGLRVFNQETRSHTVPYVGGATVSIDNNGVASIRNFVMRADAKYTAATQKAILQALARIGVEKYHMSRLHGEMLIPELRNVPSAASPIVGRIIWNRA